MAETLILERPDIDSETLADGAIIDAAERVLGEAPVAELDGAATIDVLADTDPVAAEALAELAGGVGSVAIDGAAPELKTSVGDLFDRAKDTRMYRFGQRLEDMRALKDARAQQRQAQKTAASTQLSEGYADLDAAKSARATTRLTHNRFTQYMKKHELAGQKIRELKQDDQYNSAGFFRRRKVRKLAIADAGAEAEKWRTDARAAAKGTVLEARAKIADAKAQRRDASYFSRKGGTNSLRENFKIAGGGFNIGEISDGGLSEEQKKKLEEQMKLRLKANARTARHSVRGRISTRTAAQIKGEA